MRDPFFDVCKFFAMYMVVFGHIMLAHGVTFLEPYILNAIVAVNLPIFFVVSGIFFARYSHEGLGIKCIKRCLLYTYPVFVISLLWALVYSCVANRTVAVFMRSFVISLASYWFIWCLICCQLLTTMIKKLSDRYWDGAFWCFCGVVYFVLLILSEYFEFVNRFVNMWPYFILGMCALDKKKIWQSWRLGMTCLLVFILSIVLEGDCRVNGMGYYWTRVSVCSLWLLALRFLLGVAGIIAFMMIVDRMCQTFKWFKALSFFGSTTLGVYLIHMKFVPYCKLFYESGNVAFALLETTVLFVICHYITSWTQCCPIVSKLLWWSSGRSKK